MSDKNGSGGNPDVDALREEIKQTRADLGETVQALAAKADVKARAKDELEQTKVRVKENVADATAKTKEAVATAADRVRGVAASATASAKGAVAQAGDKARETGALDKAYGARAQVQNNPTPYAAVLVGLAAVLGVILIVRGRRA